MSHTPKQAESSHRVTVVKHHTFAGKEYQPGDTYTVKGDGHQTADQYLDSLTGAGLAKLHGDESGPNIVNEIGPDPATAVPPLSTENFTTPAEPEPAKAETPKRQARKTSGATRASKK